MYRAELFGYIGRFLTEPERVVLAIVFNMSTRPQTRHVQERARLVDMVQLSEVTTRVNYLARVFKMY